MQDTIEELSKQIFTVATRLELERKSDVYKRENLASIDLFR